eukprot:8917479-Pyramimonas_sp.AAC.1
MTAELGTAIPADGGQVAWVHTAFGRIIGGHNGYWIWFTNVPLLSQAASRASAVLTCMQDGSADVAEYV